MSIVKGLVEQMHGEIKVTSEKGMGSTFAITIPFEIAQKKEQPVAEKMVEQADIRGLNLLVAEDKQLNAEIIQTLLTDDGANVTVVEDGQQAVDQFKNAPQGTFDAKMCIRDSSPLWWGFLFIQKCTIVTKQKKEK